MLKIIKYEFIKSRVSLLVMLLVALGLFLLSPLGKLLHREDMMTLSLVLLFLYAFAAFLYALVRGISAYSGELRGRTGYLLMMIPRSAMSVLFGKLLFSLCFAALMLAVTVLALFASFAQVLPVIAGPEYRAETIWNLMRIALYQIGITPMQLASIALYFAVETLSSLLALVGISYLSVTLSATLLQDRKGRGLVSALFFVALLALTNYLQEFASPEIDVLYHSFEEALRAALPASLLLIALTCAYTAGSAVLLQKKVSL